MGILDFFKKKPKAMSQGELKIPSPQDPDAVVQPYPSYSSGLEAPITARFDELEIPMPPKELELPRLEFPSLMHEPETKAEEKRSGVVMPALEDLEAEAPAELPDLEGESGFPTISPSVPSFPVPSSPKPTSLMLPKPEKKETKPLSFEELEAPVVIRHLGGPLYINLSGYKAVMVTVDDIRDNLKQSNDHLDTINSLKNRQDSALEAWHSSLENIQRKMIFIDRSLFERQEG